MVSSIKGLCSNVVKDLGIFVTGATAGLASAAGAFQVVSQIDPRGHAVSVATVAMAGIIGSAVSSVTLDRHINKAEPVSASKSEVIIRMAVATLSTVATFALFDAADSYGYYRPRSTAENFMRVWTYLAVASVTSVLLLNRRSKKVAVETSKGEAVETQKTSASQIKAVQPKVSLVQSRAQYWEEQTKKDAEAAAANVRKKV